MKPEDNAKAVHEAKEITDMLADLRDIEAIFANANAGFGFDRHKAKEIIRKNNTSDPFLLVRNNQPENTIPLSQANDQTIAKNLAFLHSYLSGKLTAKLQNAADKEHK